MLHIIKTVSALEDAMPLCSAQDDILLIEDAVYAANSQHKASHLKNRSVFVLESDIHARGIANRISPSLTIVNYSGFVELTVKQDKSLTWD